jgi:hypothetical protein
MLAASPPFNSGQAFARGCAFQFGRASAPMMPQRVFAHRQHAKRVPIAENGHARAERSLLRISAYGQARKHNT